MRPALSTTPDLGLLAGTRTWDASSGETRCEVRLPHYPGVGVFSHDSRRFATSARGDPIQLVDIATRKAIVVPGAPVGGTNVVALSRDDTSIATGDGDAVIRIYDAATGQKTAENRDLQMIPLAFDLTADGATAIAGSGDKSRTHVHSAGGAATSRAPSSMRYHLLGVHPRWWACARTPAR